MKKLYLAIIFVVLFCASIANAQSPPSAVTKSARPRGVSSLPPTPCSERDWVQLVGTPYTTSLCKNAAWVTVGSGSGSVTGVSGTAPINVANGTTTPVVSLNDTAVTPGDYTNANITVDQKGRLTLAASGSAGIAGSGAANRVAFWSGANTLSSNPAFTYAGLTLTANNVSADNVNATAYNGLAITNNGTNTLNITAGKSLIVSNSLTFTGTDSSSIAFGAGGTVLYSGGALFTPSSGTVTNLTGTASININGTVGSTTPAAGAFTTVSASSAITGTSASASALAVGRQGATAPALKVNAATATQATGVEIIGAAAGGNVAVNAISSGSDEYLIFNGKGTGVACFGAAWPSGACWFPGSTSFVLPSSGTLAAASSGILNITNPRVTNLATATNCADSAGAAACGSAAAGSVVIDAGSTSVVVTTTALTANSQVIPVFDSSLGTRLSVTCNTTIALPAITARTGTTFTITVAVAPAINPGCFSYIIRN